MKKQNFTAERIAGFKCATDKQQTIYRDGKTPGLGLRVTASGTKSYIFEAALNGKTIRLTIGDPRTWKISEAQAEATRLKTITDQGGDPRQIKADQASELEAKSATLKLKIARESLTFATVWKEYLEARKKIWGERHYNDHQRMVHPGGDIRKRSTKLTEPGALASLSDVRLIDITSDRVSEWAKHEGAKRGGQARLAHRQLKAFLTWCTEHKKYKEIITSNPAQHKSTRENLGKPKLKQDSLQREQLADWFATIRTINNPVISAYLQALLLTGARPGELIDIKWKNVDFRWKKLTIGDKTEGSRTIPLTPYVARLLSTLQRRNIFVFNSPTSATGHLEDPHDSYSRACAEAGIEMEMYGLRRSFASLSEWIEMPSGIGAQIQGHKPSG
ncbi:MAG: integrase arm-type DNA-binding domain-containing protein, partial [Gallionella sp.]